MLGNICLFQQTLIRYNRIKWRVDYNSKWQGWIMQTSRKPPTLASQSVVWDELNNVLCRRGSKSICSNGELNHLKLWLLAIKHWLGGEETPKIIHFTDPQIAFVFCHFTGATMSPFLRIGLSNFDCGSCQPCQGEAINPYCAVLVKEYVESGKLEWVFQEGMGEENPAMNSEARPFRVFEIIWFNLIFHSRKLMPREAQYFLRGKGLSDHLWTSPRSPACVLFHWTIFPHEQREQRKGEMGLRTVGEELMGLGWSEGI